MLTSMKSIESNMGSSNPVNQCDLVFFMACHLTAVFHLFFPCIHMLIFSIYFISKSLMQYFLKMLAKDTIFQSEVLNMLLFQQNFVNFFLAKYSIHIHTEVDFMPLAFCGSEILVILCQIEIYLDIEFHVRKLSSSTQGTKISPIL